MKLTPERLAEIEARANERLTELVPHQPIRDRAALLAHIRAREEVAQREECPCDRESAVDPHCAAAGMCARESVNG